MATPLDTLLKKQTSLEGKIASSPTYISPDPVPFKTDVGLSSQLASVRKQIDAAKSTQLRNQWYGPSSTGSDTGETVAPESPGLFMQGLTALQKPLNVIAGATQYALGKGTEKSLTENMAKAAQTGLEFGTILNQYNVPRVVAAPLGFALDVFADPVNWATMGTGALIPRVGTGLVKGTIKEGALSGGLAAAKEGLTSNLAKKAATVMDLVPFAKRYAKTVPKVAEEGAALTAGDTFKNALIKGSQKYAETAAGLGRRAITGAEKYDTMIGSDVWSRLNKGIIPSITGEIMPAGTIGRGIENLVSKIPSVTIAGKATPTGPEIVDFFKYSTQKAAEVADARDQAINAFKANKIYRAVGDPTKTSAHFEKLAEYLSPKATIPVVNQFGQPLLDESGNILKQAIWDLDLAGEQTLKRGLGTKVTVRDNFDNAKALLDMSGQEYNLKRLADAYKTVPKGKTGVEWYDNAISKLASTSIGDIKKFRFGPGEVAAPVGQQAQVIAKTWNTLQDAKANIDAFKPLESLLTAHRAFTSVFKQAKVMMNLGSNIVANLGNTVMAKMIGIPVESPEFWNSFVKANRVARGTLGADGLKEVFLNDANSMLQMMTDNPTRFQAVFGESGSEILRKIGVGEAVTDKVASDRLVTDTVNYLEEEMQKLEKIWAEEERLAELSAKGELKLSTASETLAKLMEQGGALRTEIPGSFAANEIQQIEKIEKMKLYFKNLAIRQPYNPVARLADVITNTMPKWYEQVDQTWKIATTDYLTRVGLNETQLALVSRSVPITAKDVLDPVVRGAEKFYRLRPLKATEVAMEAFMNYSGMPDFVRIMRNLPIVGAPFVSFPYAMLAKTGKTLVHNPALFNKVAFMINEISGARTPEEKAALENKYNAYLNSPTVMKIFGMWNTDVKNWVPYYQMNMLNPSQRKYDDSVGGTFLKLSDNFPVLQDPIGQVIKDYYLQPWILSMGGSKSIPQGQFGQPLYPAYDASGKPISVDAATKAFYALRSTGEAVVPGSLAYLGLLNIALNLTPEQINVIPSYGLRNVAFATQGKSSIGATTKEEAMQKTIRSLFGRTGIPLYTLDTSKSPGNVKMQ